MADVKMYQGTKCSENLVEAALFMDPTCEMALPGPSMKIEFNQGKVFCGNLQG